jgi:hypothetical protein
MSIPYMSGSLLPRHTGASRFPLRRRRKAAEAANLRLVSAGTAIPIKLAAGSPTLMMLAVEDLCWQLGAGEHAARRPATWHRAARAAWDQEAKRWEAKRARLAAMSNEAIAEL